MPYSEPVSDPQTHKAQAIRQLMHELEKGRKSGEENGWLSLEDVEKSLGIAKTQQS